jgi:hypothetical protein
METYLKDCDVQVKAAAEVSGFLRNSAGFLKLFVLGRIAGRDRCSKAAAARELDRRRQVA